MEWSTSKHPRHLRHVARLPCFFRRSGRPVDGDGSHFLPLGGQPHMTSHRLAFAPSKTFMQMSVKPARRLTRFVSQLAAPESRMCGRRGRKQGKSSNSLVESFAATFVCRLLPTLHPFAVGLNADVGSEADRVLRHHGERRYRALCLCNL